MIVTPKASALVLLDELMESLTPYYHLYTNDFTPSVDTTMSMFVEADWPDYVAMKAKPWNPAFLLCGRAVATADQLLWVRGLAGFARQVYGYYVTDGTGGPLLWCERRTMGPIPMISQGNAVKILPRFTLRQDPDPETDCGPFRAGGGDVVGDGSSTHVLPPISGGGDLVGDGSSTHVLPPISGGGDLVGDGSSTSGPFARPGLGDVVGDGSSTSGPIVRFGGGDLVGDGEATI